MAEGQAPREFFEFRGKAGKSFRLRRDQLDRFPESLLPTLTGPSEWSDGRSERVIDLAIAAQDLELDFAMELYSSGSLARACQQLPRSFSLKQLRNTLDYFQLPAGQVLDPAAAAQAIKDAEGDPLLFSLQLLELSVQLACHAAARELLPLICRYWADLPFDCHEARFVLGASRDERGAASLHAFIHCPAAWERLYPSCRVGLLGSDGRSMHTSDKLVQEATVQKVAQLINDDAAPGVKASVQKEITFKAYNEIRPSICFDASGSSRSSCSLQLQW